MFSSVHPSRGAPDLNLVLTGMDSPLVNKLMDCAKAVADGDLKLADFLFEEMEAVTAAETNEVTKKVVKYFAEALARRVHGLRPRYPWPLSPSIEIHKFFYTQDSPLHLFANNATTYDMLPNMITKSSKPVHFIDFSMVFSSWYWSDWVTKYGKAAHCQRSLRVTRVRPKASIHDDLLQQYIYKELPFLFALLVGIDFQYKEVSANSAAETVEAVLNLKRTSEDETIIVRWVYELHKLLAQEGAIEKVLSKLNDIRPDIMLIVEQEANNNTSDFFNRFSSSFDYYHSVFEASKQYRCLPSMKLLSEMRLRREISNVAASEGIDRFERHEAFTHWHERLSRAGFHSTPFPPNELTSLRFVMPGFTIAENNGSPMLCFRNRPLAVASFWKPVGRANVGKSNSMLIRDGNLNYPITIQDTEHASPSFETEAASSSDSEDDIICPPNMTRNGRIWSKEEVQMYLNSSFTGKEEARVMRWMSRKMTGNVAGHNKRLNVHDTSLMNLLRIPPPLLETVEDKQYYIDDSVINAFFELLRKRSEKFPTWYIKIYSLPTWVMSFVLSGRGSHTKVLSWLKVEEIVGSLKLFIPVCLSDHWILICVNIEKRAFLWLDSLNSRLDAHPTEKTIVSEFLIKHLLPLLGYHNSHEWQSRQLLDIPCQTNRVDCGIFVMKYADCLAHGDHFPFTEENMSHFRHRVFLDIYRGRLPVAVSSSNLNQLFQNTYDADAQGNADSFGMLGNKEHLKLVSSDAAVWTTTENKLFESALALYDKNTPDRWLKVAAMIPGKTVFDVIKHYKELEEDVSDLEAGLIPVPGYMITSSSALYNPGGNSGMTLWNF